jgi:hypothetical protein
MQLLLAESAIIQTVFIETVALRTSGHDSLRIHDLSLHNHIALPHFLHNHGRLLAGMIGLEITDIHTSTDFTG